MANTKQLLAFTEAYNKLNPEQKLAVDTIEGPMLIIAGPGTGKTQVLALRVANILRQTQMEAKNILCLTFTEAGVHAMRERLLQFIGVQAHQVAVHTFHSFCNEIIISHPEKFPRFGESALQLGDIARIALIEELVSALPSDSRLKPLNNPFIFVREIADQISNLKRESITADAYSSNLNQLKKLARNHEKIFADLFTLHFSKLSSNVFEDLFLRFKRHKFDTNPLFTHLQLMFNEAEEAEKPSYTQLRQQMKSTVEKYLSSYFLEKQSDFVEIYKAYETELANRGSYDYEDMITLVVEKLSTDTDLLSSYQERYQYLLLDEYQDTNSAQNKVVEMLGSYFEQPNICVVGDDDQSIYRFQGASLENLLFFSKRFAKGLKTVVLKQNYRSQQTLIDAAQSVIANNSYRINEIIPNIEKKLVQAKTNHRKKQAVDVFEFNSEAEEDYFIAKRIKSLLEKGTAPSDIAVIYAKHAHAVSLKLVLEKNNIKYKSDKGDDVLNDKLIKQLLVLLQYLGDAVNDELLFRILNFEFLGFKALDLAKVASYSFKNKIPVSDLLASRAELKAAGVAQAAQLSEFYEELSEFKQQGYNIEPSELLVKLLNSKTMNILGKINALPFRLQSLIRVNRLLQEIKSFSSRQDSASLDDLFEHLARFSQYGVKLEDQVFASAQDAVNFTTAHGAKGLEFEHVFLIRATASAWEGRGKSNQIGILPGLMATEAFSNTIDERRRLFYVAMTRAKQSLYLTLAKNDPEQSKQNESTFVTEINSEFKQVQQPHNKNETLAEILSNQLSSYNPSDNSNELLDSLLANYRLSATDLNSYLKCPRCFLYQKIIKIPEIKAPVLAYGTAVHFALREFINQSQSGKKADADFLLNAFRRQLRSSGLDEEVENEYLAKGETALTDFYKQLLAAHELKSIAEYNLAKENIVVEGVPLTGKIDRIDFLKPDNKTVEIVDYKTGNPDSKSAYLSERSLGEYFKQLIFYKILLENSSYQEMRVDTARIQFIEKNKKGVIPSRVYSIKPQQQEAVKTEIKTVYEKILAHDFAHCGKSCDNEHIHLFNADFLEK